jgi:hypothetical protein
LDCWAIWNFLHFPSHLVRKAFQLHNLHPVGRFWFDHLCEGVLFPFHDDWVTEVRTDDLFQQFKTEYPKVSLSKNQFGIKLREFCVQIVNAKSSGVMTDAFGQDHKAGIRVYRIPDLDTCRTLFSKRMGFDIVWNDPEVSEDELEPVPTSYERSRVPQPVATTDTDGFDELEAITLDDIGFFDYSQN